MPFTYFHLGPAILFGLMFYHYLDFPTFVAANVVVDTRAAFIYLGPWEGQIHGPLQTFAGGAVAGLLLAGAVYIFRSPIDEVLSRFRLAQKMRPWRLVVAGLAGTWLHVVMDSVMWSDVQPFAPFGGNPFLGLVGLETVRAFAFSCAVIAVPVYFYGIRSGWFPERV